MRLQKSILVESRVVFAEVFRLAQILLVGTFQWTEKKVETIENLFLCGFKKSVFVKNGAVLLGLDFVGWQKHQFTCFFRRPFGKISPVGGSYDPSGAHFCFQSGWPQQLV